MELVKAFEILRSKYSAEELKRSLDILRAIIKQLDGRTVGLLAYNDWNTHPIRCWCSKAPYECPCTPFKDEIPEKWMSLACDFSNLNLVAAVEVSDIAGIGLAFNGELFYREWGGFDCDTLPELALRLIEDLEKLNASQ